MVLWGDLLANKRFASKRRNSAAKEAWRAVYMLSSEFKGNVRLVRFSSLERVPSRSSTDLDKSLPL